MLTLMNQMGKSNMVKSDPSGNGNTVLKYIQQIEDDVKSDPSGNGNLK